MIDCHALRVLKGVAPLGDTLCIGTPEVNIRGVERRDYRSILRGCGASDIYCLDLANCNLNEPIELCRSYDTVYDCGTLEHVACPTVALESYIRHIGTGGKIIIHTTTDSCQRHGFYQFNPELFFGLFSERNGFFGTKVWTHRIGPCAKLKRERADDFGQRLTMSLPRYLIVSTARLECRQIQWPIQRIYSSPTKRAGKLASGWQLATSLIKSLR